MMSQEELESVSPVLGGNSVRAALALAPPRPQSLSEDGKEVTRRSRVLPHVPR